MNPKLASKKKFDSIIIGGGIAGLAASAKLHERGVDALVLEAETRLGGRMRTDRVGDYLIDRGVTILGNRFRGINQLVCNSMLQDDKRKALFHVCVKGRPGDISFRSRHPWDLLLSSAIPIKQKAALIRVGIDAFRLRDALAHGNSPLVANFDTETTAEYFQRIGAEQLFTEVLGPCLDAPTGGCIRDTSKVIFLQTLWNIIISGTWNLIGGIDRIVDVLAEGSPIVTNARVSKISKPNASGLIRVTAVIDGKVLQLETATVILAIPGDLVSEICSWVSSEILPFLDSVSYSPMGCVTVGLEKKPALPGYSSMVFGDRCDVHSSVQLGYALEFQHHRAPHRCPMGKGLVSTYFWGAELQRASTEELESMAISILNDLEITHPKGVEFTHFASWKRALARFPTGRIQQLAKVRAILERADSPLQFCGDYLDGLSCEGALQTGYVAAENIVRYLRS